MTTRSKEYITIMTPTSRLTAIYPMHIYTVDNIPAGEPAPKAGSKKLTVAQLIKLYYRVTALVRGNS
jgi:hypothetical protein